jgi:Class II flagellar assembly regulator
MKVEGPRATEAAGIRRASRTPSGQPAFSLDGAGAAPKAAPFSMPAPVGALDSILALQAVPDASQGRARAVKRGQSLLALLDELRDGLLSGAVPEGVLRRLSAELQVRQDEFLEPGLQSVMNDIEIRAQVELAKMRVFSGRRDSAAVA